MASDTDIPLHYAEPITRLFSDDGSIPNNPKLPLVVYPCEYADSGQDLAPVFEERFRANNWTNSWRNGIYTYHHYHSRSHEALAVYSGEAKVLFGGESGEALDLKRGDVVVIPAGVGHKKLESSGDFGVVGAYPEGRDYDVLRGDKEDRPQARENIRSVPLPDTDPLFGEIGSLIRIWGAK